MTTYVYKIRRESDGMFFGSKKWGKSHSTFGKIYKTMAHAKSAVKGAHFTDQQKAEHEFVEFKCTESRVCGLDCHTWTTSIIPIADHELKDFKKVPQL